jgi:hypothetical protein
LWLSFDYTLLTHSLTAAALLLLYLPVAGPAARENDVLAPLRGCKGYISSPWPHPQVPAAAAVGIIGTGACAMLCCAVL